MSALPKRFFTPAGEIFAMAGATPLHDRVKLNTFMGIHSRLRGGSGTVFAPMMRVCAADDLHTYPDVTALCGEPEFGTASKNPPSLLSPRVIFEVLSPAAEQFDRGIKFARYRQLETLTDYVLVAIDQRRVEHHRLRDDGAWDYDDLGERDILRLLTIGRELPLVEIYERVTLPTAGR